MRLARCASGSDTASAGRPNTVSKMRTRAYEKRNSKVLRRAFAPQTAATRVYRPMSYDQADFQRAYVFWKMGGRAAAALAYNTLGTPSIDSARRHVSTTPIRSSPCTPSVEDMDHNLAIYFNIPDDARPTSIRKITGATIVIDEIRTQPCLRWDARRNMILGVCREHGGDFVLEFRTMVQADALLEGLKKNEVHFKLASEVCEHVLF